MNRGSKRTEKIEIYRELTPAGIGLCAVMGAAAEIILLSVLGIRQGTAPVFALLVLWGMLGFLASGLVLAADSLKCLLSISGADAILFSTEVIQEEREYEQEIRCSNF